MLASSSPALAQLSPLPGSSLVVAITSPPSGVRVGDTIAVSANASSLLGVAGVQFKLDGIDLGPEDTTAPYSVSWDTSTAGDGWHTLTAVARDSSGLQLVSDPVTVTVANTPAPDTPVARYEETDASVSFSAGWVQGDSGWPWSGGTAAYALSTGAQATFTFTGTSVTWLGYRSSRSGIARVLVDGVFVAEVDMYARTDEIRVPVFTMSGLTDSSHTLTIEATGMKNKDALVDDGIIAAVVVDAFDVPGPAVSRLQDSDPSITYTPGWTGGDTSNSWTGQFATLSTTPAEQATLTFSGTSVSWIGYRGPEAGIARVYLDGVFAGEVDAYSPTGRIQDSLFTATGLADASHTLTIEVTGLKNDASTDALIVVDAFEVTTPGIRFEETDWSVAYSGGWTLGNLNRTWSGGTIAVSSTAGSQAAFTFRGTSVSWIGFRAARTGIARVYLDGIFLTEVDTYAPTEGFQNTVFTISGLADTSHTLIVEATGRANPSATNTYVGVDAFDVRR
jgi:hypothetical protein